MRIENSKKYFEDARKFLVGGVNSPVRSFKAVGGSPIVMKYARGAKLFDYDNNAFTDYCLSWGALILGHSNRNVVLQAKKTAEKGISFGAICREEIEIARHIINCVPSIELIRFVNSGTEATMSAIRLARGFTKRDKLVKFDGCYHGHFDDLLTKAGSGVAELSESSSLGIPQTHIKNTISLPYNDVDILEKTLTKFKDEIACVIIEPVCGNMGVIPAKIEFLKSLRELTKKFGIVLIFDEIIMGFRSSSGCVQGDYGIYPDITCLGKIIGGGFPVGAYGGRKDIMQCLAPLGGVYQAGTFAGNPVVMKAGLAALRLLTKEFYKSLNERAERFANNLNEYFIEQGINAHLSAYKSMMSVFFRKEKVLNYDDALAANSSKLYAGMFNHLLNAGIYFPPADLETFFISIMHTKADLVKLETEIKYFFKQNKFGTP